MSDSGISFPREIAGKGRTVNVGRRNPRVFRFRRGLRCATGGLAAVTLLIGVRLALAQRAALPYSKDQSRERRDRARFPHNKEKHRTLECAKCHEVTLAQPVVER